MCQEWAVRSGHVQVGDPGEGGGGGGLSREYACLSRHFFYFD